MQNNNNKIKEGQIILKMSEDTLKDLWDIKSIEIYVR